MPIEIDGNGVIMDGRNARNGRGEGRRGRPSAWRDPSAFGCRTVSAAMVVSLGPRRRTVAMGQPY